MSSGGPDRTEEWGRLLAFLERHGPVTELESGRILWKPDRAGRQFEIILTPEEWNTMWSVLWGDVQGGYQDVLRSVDEAGPDERFLVYADYRLEPSSTPELPEDDGSPPGPGGRWSAYPDGPER